MVLALATLLTLSWRKRRNVTTERVLHRADRRSITQCGARFVELESDIPRIAE